MSDWKQIDNLPYSVNKNGDVRNDRTGKILKPVIVSGGYLQVRLWVNYKVYNKLVHRLVANAYIDNPFGKETVNHLDGNKQNNNVSNLEWATKSENQKHRYDVLGKRGHNPSTQEANEACRKKVRCLDTGYVYNSITEAARKVNGSQPGLSECLIKNRKEYKGMRWEYVQ